MAVAEALARGLPVISTATGGIPGLVSDEAGIVVAPGDQAAFTAALERVVGDAGASSTTRRGGAAGPRSPADVGRRGRRDGTRPRSRTESDLGVGVPVSEFGVGVPVPESVPESCRVVPESVRSRSEFGRCRLQRRLAGAARARGPAARSTRLTRAIADSFAQGAELRVLDLGAGTGANMRYLAPRLPEPQRWLLVDHDAALLASVATRDDGPRRVATRQLDLRAIGDREAREMFSGRALVTASALLDLVSEEWMRALGAQVSRGRRRAAVRAQL